jgi:hypothetical protein
VKVRAIGALPLSQNPFHGIMRIIKLNGKLNPSDIPMYFGETETVTTATLRFEWLVEISVKGSAWLLDIIKAFSVERISAEFFKGYHHLFRKV